MLTLLAIAVAGFVAQLVDGSLGMGYGVTSTSVLLTFGLAPALVSASVHLAEIGTSAVSGFSHWKLGNVDWKLLLRLGIPGGIGAFLGAVVLSNLSLEAARPWVSVVLLVLGGAILARFLYGRRATRPADAASAPAEASGEGPAPAATPGKPVRRSRSWMLIPLGLVGGFMDASGGGGWGPVTTSSLMAAGRRQPRKIIGTVSGSEFIVSICASAGFLLALGSAGVRWDVVLMMLIGGSIAAPIAAYVVRHFDDRSLGTAVGGLIIVLNADRVLGLLSFDPAIMGAARIVALAVSAVIVGALLVRGRRARLAVGSGAA